MNYVVDISYEECVITISRLEQMGPHMMLEIRLGYKTLVESGETGSLKCSPGTSLSHRKCDEEVKGQGGNTLKITATISVARLFSVWRSLFTSSA